jgi:AraC family transcriptional regulator of adaptative response/methylated-DNA-[protein]-cysteine methyltransferase
MRYGIHPTPFGPCLLALTDRGICELWFVDAPEASEEVGALVRRWPGARVREDSKATGGMAAQIFEVPRGGQGLPIPVLLGGTNFQLKVWRALLRIPAGAVVSYSALAVRLGTPSGARAVGNAVGRNPLAYLIPCHRVLRESGDLGGYRWGTARKQAMLAREFAAAESPGGDPPDRRPPKR